MSLMVGVGGRSQWRLEDEEKECPQQLALCFLKTTVPQTSCAYPMLNIQPEPPEPERGNSFWPRPTAVRQASSGFLLSEFILCCVGDLIAHHECFRMLHSQTGCGRRNGYTLQCE